MIVLCRIISADRKIERNVRDEITNEFQTKILSLQQELVQAKKENEKIYAVLSTVLRQSNGIAETVRDVLSK